MKKLFMLAVALMSVCAVSAQNELIAKYNEGVTALGANNHNAAIESFEAFIDKGADSEDATVLANVAQAKKYVAQCYLVLGAKNAKAQKFAEAEALLNEGLVKAELYGETQTLAKMKGMLAKVYLAMGGTAYNSKDYATAAEVFAKGYAADPRNTGLALNLAMSYCELGKFDKGMEIYRNIAAMNPSRYADAVAKAKEMISFYTINQVAKFQADGNNDAVIEMAEKMLAEDPASALAEKIRLQAYNGKKEYDKVIELGENAAMAQTSDEEKSDVYFLIGAAYNAKYNAGGNKDAALKDKAVSFLNKVAAGNSVEAAKAAVAELTK